MVHTKRRRRGRPPKEPGEGRLDTLAFRPSLDTRKLIEESARASGHSLSTEIDRRLQQAYWNKDRLRSEAVRNFGGEHNFALGFLLARLATGVEHWHGSTWQGNGPLWQEVATAIVATLQLMLGLGGGTVQLPCLADGLRPNPAWDVDTQSRAQGKSERPEWFSMARMIQVMLSQQMPLTFPLVDIIKRRRDDFREDIMPAVEDMRRLYAHAQVPQTRTDSA